MSNREHQLRWITASIGLALLGSIYYLFTHTGLTVIVAVISVVAYFELLQFSLHTENTPQQRRKKLYLGVIAALIFLSPLPNAQYYSLLCILLSTVFFAQTGNLKIHLGDTVISIFGLTYILGFLTFIPKIHALPQGPMWLITFLLIIWMGDAMAYYGGRMLGRRKFSPTISPNKTWEGFFSGLVGAMLVTMLVGVSPYNISANSGSASIFIFLAMGAVTSAIAQAGDLLESLLKRVGNVKDSGSLLPGHGGVLDRFDSCILAAPFYYFFLEFFLAM